mgnify:CR=1 FL=1
MTNLKLIVDSNTFRVYYESRLKKRRYEMEYLIIADDSCNGQEKQFLAWMEINHPEISTSIELVAYGSYMDEDNEFIDENDLTGNKFWEEFCNAR